jgi:hypothetical protein
MVLFEELFDETFDDEEDIMETMSVFYRQPTLKSAENMLIALDIHVPYSTLLRKTRRQSVTSGPQPATLKRARMRGGVHPGISDTDAKINILRRVDFLHDLQDSKRIPEAMIDVVLMKAPLTNIQRAWFVSQCRKMNHPTVDFTIQVGKRLENLFGLPRSKTKLGSMSADKALYDRVTGWMQKPTLEVVIDGLIEVPKRNANMSPKEARGLCLFAFFMLLFGKAHDVPGPLPSGCLAISVLTGTFQDMDVGRNGFLTRWIGAFNRHIGCAKVALVNVGSVPQPWDSAVRVEPSQVVLVPHNISVPFRYPNIATPQKPKMSVDFAAMAHHETNLHVLFQKSYLQDVQTSFVALPTTDQRHFHPYIHRLVRVNALRDEYKADVALRRGAIFMTVDRIAHIYYSVRARDRSLQDQGVYYSVHGTNDASLIMYQ